MSNKLLNSYIRQVETRLRVARYLRGSAIFACAALLTTIIAVPLMNASAFSISSVLSARGALVFVLAVALGLGLIVPLLRLTRRRAAAKAESTFPQFQQRLVTFVELGDNAREPFIELLAADTLAVARDAEPARLAPSATLLASLGAGIAATGILIWMIAAGPGYLGYGARLLWAGPHKNAAPLYQLRVTPGDATVRRNGNQLVTAQLIGMQPDVVRLFARYQSASKWDEVPMQPERGGSGYVFLFAGLPEGVEYYVQAGALHSRHFNLRVVDLPGVKSIRVTYRFPAWTGLPSIVEGHGGDLRAVEGSEAELEVKTDRPLSDGLLVLDTNQQIRLSGGAGSVYKGTIAMKNDGLYHVAVLDRGEAVRLSEDFFIETNKPNPPEVHIRRPGRDYRSSPIEEVTVDVGATDEFGLKELALHYSVNGGPEQTVDLLKAKGQRQAEGSSVLSLENFKLVPGDVVSIYATAKNALLDSRTDMFFIQSDPFEREFSQSQQDGGGGGGGGSQADQTNISEREKQIIATTWKQQGDKNATRQHAADTGKFLSEIQSKLADQARSLAYRVQSRELTQESEEFNDFNSDMNKAAEAMGPAIQKLRDQKWKDAIPGEQKALQHLLRAEATFRQIEVAFSSGSGGNRGGGGAGRDLTSLFDLELDTQKNQYEAAQAAFSADQRAKQIDESLRKLEQLARRQEELAQLQNQSAQNFQRSWQQEMLRREAEELQRQMEHMVQNGQQGSSSSNSQSGQSSSSQPQAQGAQSQSSQSQGGIDVRVRQALDRLRQATEDMRRAASSGRSDAESRRAAEQLREALNLLGGAQQQAASRHLDSMTREADRLSAQQRDQSDRLRQHFGQQNSSGSSGVNSYSDRAGQMQALATDRQRLADDLARLEKQLQDSVRDLAPSHRRTASKLRDALGDLDQGDLQTRIQRSADGLRRGSNANSPASEDEIASSLQRLGDQLQQAQQSLGSDQQQGTESALDRLDRLRGRLDAMLSGVNGRNTQGRQQNSQGRNPNTGQPGRTGGQNGHGRAGDDSRGDGKLGTDRSADPDRGVVDRSMGNGNVGPGGYRDGRAYGNIDTGNNSNFNPPVAAPDTRAVPPDPAKAIQQGVRELNQLRAAMKDDPEMLRQIQDLIAEMQRLDPRRFPGNPALVEQLHARVLNDVNKLELQLRRKSEGKQSGQVRTSAPVSVPAGYQGAVAEYFRRLSKNR